MQNNTVFNAANVAYMYNSAQAAKLAYNAQFIESEDDSDLPALRDWVKAVSELPEEEQAQVIRDVGDRFESLIDCWACKSLYDYDLKNVARILAINITD